MFQCSNCSFFCKSLVAYSQHIVVHKNEKNSVFTCGTPGCVRSFSIFSSFKSHINRNHKKNSVSEMNTHSNLCDVSFKCNLEMCEFHCKDITGLFAHLRCHISEGVSVSCPFKTCKNNEFKVVSSFTSHLSRCHKDWTLSLFSDSVIINSDRVRPETIDDHGLEQGSECLGGNVIDTDNGLLPQGEEDLEIPINNTQFMHSLALFYLKMQAELLLPASNIQMLLCDFNDIHLAGESYKSSKVSRKLKELNISDEDTRKIMAELQNVDLIKKYNLSVFKTDHLRKSYFKKYFMYVAPVDIYLGKDRNGSNRFCKYVPITETLQALLSQKSVKMQLFESLSKSFDGSFYRDFDDASVFSDNSFFTQNPSALRIILYQDGYEVVNPLGSGKKKHKILGVYFMLGNILPHLRSNIAQMQLVLLCTESDFKYFGHKVLFSSLVEDLKKLETGFEIEGDFSGRYTVKGSVVFIVGDNLGSHCIGGFTENFSTSEYFCRYCHISRDTFRNQPHKRGTPRNEASYADDLQQLESNSLCMSRGIKFDSVFNQLSHFHVCQPGMPPCLGHDLFEGVVSGDLMIFLDYFVKTDKSFSYSELNKAISNFAYKGTDAQNKPCSLNPTSDKLTGSATQNWCLLRLLPVLIGKKILNPVVNEVWQLYLQLKEIVELVTSPCISTHQVAYLNELTEDYVDMRARLFPNKSLKPKHHYLLHYAELICKFGPLIRVWAMRFESKHTYFKKCARQLRNFKNLPATLAERHQLLQAYYSAGNLFPYDMKVGDGIPFYVSCFSQQVQAAVRGF